MIPPRSLEYECIIQARKRNIVSKFEILYDGQCAYVVTGERAAIAMTHRLVAKTYRDIVRHSINTMIKASNDWEGL